MIRRMLTKIALSAVAAMVLGGCSTVFHASAPAATQGMEYVVGGRGGLFSAPRTMWLCPTGAASGECQRVEVQD